MISTEVFTFAVSKYFKRLNLPMSHLSTSLIVSKFWNRVGKEHIMSTYSSSLNRMKSSTINKGLWMGRWCFNPYMCSIYSTNNARKPIPLLESINFILNFLLSWPRNILFLSDCSVLQQLLSPCTL